MHGQQTEEEEEEKEQADDRRISRPQHCYGLKQGERVKKLKKKTMDNQGIGTEIFNVNEDGMMSALRHKCIEKVVSELRIQKGTKDWTRAALRSPVTYNSIRMARKINQLGAALFAL